MARENFQLAERATAAERAPEEILVAMLKCKIEKMYSAKDNREKKLCSGEAL